MEEKEKDLMRKMHVKLVRELDTTGLLLSHLFQDNVLSEEDVEKIKAKKTSKKRAEKLLKTLKKRRRGLKMLIKALILSKIQDFLGFEILEKVTWSEEEKETFLEELDGDLDEQQKVEAELVEAKREIQQLKLRCAGYERELNEKDEHLRRSVSSQQAHRFNFFRKFFRQAKKKQDKAVSSEDFPSLPPRNGYVGDHLEELSSVQCSTNSASGSRIARYSDSIRENQLEFADSRRSSTRQSTSSAPDRYSDSFWENQLEFAHSRRSSTRQSTRSAPVPRETEAKSRASSRTGSVVSSASLRIRNAFRSVRRKCKHTRLMDSQIYSK